MISVIVPVYNRTLYLGKTLESVLSQIYSDWELIVVDDGSEEDIEEFMRSYQDRRITTHRQTNQGNAVARNAGIRKAKGEFVICLDSDDVWEPEMLETCVNEMQSASDIDVVYVQHRLIDSNDMIVKGSLGPKPRNGYLLEYLLMGFPILPSSALVRSRCFKDWGVYTPGMDDWEMWLRWATKGCRFSCVERPLLRYRVHDQNLNLDWASRRTAHFAMLDKYYQMDDLPSVAVKMRRRAYSNQHAQFAILAWQLNRPDDASQEFKKAIYTDTHLLTNLDFHTRVACAEQSRSNYKFTHELDLEMAERVLIQSFDSLFSESDLPAFIRNLESTAYAWAYLALARLAYSVPHDDVNARRLLLKSLSEWPPILWHTTWLIWMVRVLIGYKTVQNMKRVLKARLS